VKVLLNEGVLHEVVRVTMPMVYPNQRDFWGTACGVRFDDFDMTEVFDGETNCMACMATPLEESNYGYSEDVMREYVEEHHDETL